MGVISRTTPSSNQGERMSYKKIVDARKDIAGYAIIALMLNRDYFNLELED